MTEIEIKLLKSIHLKMALNGGYSEKERNVVLKAYKELDELLWNTDEPTEKGYYEVVFSHIRNAKLDVCHEAFWNGKEWTNVMNVKFWRRQQEHTFR